LTVKFQTFEGINRGTTKSPGRNVRGRPGDGRSILESVQELMGAVDEHGKATGADDLFLAFVVAGEKGLFLVVGAANEAFDLFVRHVIPPALR
jgi:hypothetical protein